MLIEIHQVTTAIAQPDDDHSRMPVKPANHVSRLTTLGKPGVTGSTKKVYAGDRTRDLAIPRSTATPTWLLLRLCLTSLSILLNRSTFFGGFGGRKGGLRSLRRAQIELIKGLYYNKQDSILKHKLAEIQRQVMTRLKHLEEARNWTGDFSPYAMEVYNDFRIIAQGCQVQGNGDLGYEVVEGGDRHVVDLLRKRCTCRTWKALLHDTQKPLNEMHWWYSKEAYMLVYMHKIQPVR
ncbi:hypothetical protein RND71_015715 [Anisodus tanguticus]|uniref:Uncharacterized protein n=1 Tax=Anisodus tanguticus TaxID=243964 RepID=A0AAE1VD43_9SOLA|nr:hypothetical protein RND71_015715 [Anisodus tanguticus]